MMNSKVTWGRSFVHIQCALMLMHQVVSLHLTCFVSFFFFFCERKQQQKKTHSKHCKLLYFLVLEKNCFHFHYKGIWKTQDHELMCSLWKMIEMSNSFEWVPEAHCLCCYKLLLKNVFGSALKFLFQFIM